MLESMYSHLPLQNMYLRPNAFIVFAALVVLQSVNLVLFAVKEPHIVYMVP